MSSLVVGLDLGQSVDYSALAVVEKVRAFRPGQLSSQIERHWGRGTDQLWVRHLQRWPLDTSYQTVVDDVAGLMHGEALFDATLVFDGTGVGRGIKDMFWQAFGRGEMGWRRPVSKSIGHQPGKGQVAKRDLMSVLQVGLQNETLKIAEGLPLRAVLQEEFKSFRLKITAAGNDTYEFARREGSGHGDLTIAVALAAWMARRVAPRPIEDPALAE